jgi:hypothetical protein
MFLWKQFRLAYINLLILIKSEKLMFVYIIIKCEMNYQLFWTTDILTYNMKIMINLYIIVIWTIYIYKLMYIVYTQYQYWFILIYFCLHNL